MDVKSDDDDDEVIQELDVFLSNKLSDKIFLLQYPTCKNSRMYTSDQRFTARVKPKHKKLEMEVLLDVNSPNYDQSKGEQIAINVDGGSAGCSSDTASFGNSIMDVQVLTSASVPQSGKRFAAAILCHGQVHLNSVAEIMQMRPGFKYMDTAEKRAVQAAQMKAQAESGNSSQDEADDAKAVTVRFKGVETEASRSARERSYAVYEKNLFEEKWVTTSIKAHGHPSSIKERKRMLGYVEGNRHFDDSDLAVCPEMTLSASDYLKAIVPSYAVTETDSATCSHDVLSLSSLYSLSLPEQLKAVMRNVKIIHFSHLLTLLPESPDPNSVVRSLQSYASLVQGCWIVKSEVLYPPKTLSPVSGVLCENVCRARDYILCCFCRSTFLVRKDLVKKVGIPGDEVKAILEHIAMLKPKCGWYLRLEPDSRFPAMFPDVCERQAMVWTARYKQLCQQLHLPITNEPSLVRKAPKPQQPTRANKQTVKKEVVVPSYCPTNIHKMVKTESVEVTMNGFCSEATTSSHNVNQHEPMETDTSASAESHQPFISPTAVGIGTGIETSNGIENNMLQLPMTDLLSSCENPDSLFESIVLPNLNSPKINMDNIKSTVASVANEMRLQTNFPYMETPAQSNNVFHEVSNDVQE